MRLWTIHPRYLDNLTLFTCWKEAITARKELKDEAISPTHHPQLIRFRKCGTPVATMNSYIYNLFLELKVRHVKVDHKELGRYRRYERIKVGFGQLYYEFYFLQGKLKNRSRTKCNDNFYRHWLDAGMLVSNTVFLINPVNGIEKWEEVKELKHYEPLLQDRLASIQRGDLRRG